MAAVAKAQQAPQLDYALGSVTTFLSLQSKFLGKLSFSLFSSKISKKPKEESSSYWGISFSLIL